MSLTRQLIIDRIDPGTKQTIGKAYVIDANGSTIFDCWTLELPWRQNQIRISCIPIGDYLVTKRWSKKFGQHFHVRGVDGRTYILIHPGNFYTDIEGCILVGSDLSDINADGLIDVINSGDTMDKLLELMPNKFNLTIV
jgi:hypothetical protein